MNMVDPGSKPLNFGLFQLCYCLFMLLRPSRSDTRVLPCFRSNISLANGLGLVVG